MVQKSESFEKPFSAFDLKKNSIPSPGHSIIFALCLTHLLLVEKKKVSHSANNYYSDIENGSHKSFRVYIGEEANV